MTTYTKIAKPSATSYTPIFFQGKQIFDDPNIAFDDSSVFYDSVNQSLYTNVAKPTGTAYTKIAKPL